MLNELLRVPWNPGQSGTDIFIPEWFSEIFHVRAHCIRLSFTMKVLEHYRAAYINELFAENNPEKIHSILKTVFLYDTVNLDNLINEFFTKESLQCRKEIVQSAFLWNCKSNSAKWICASMISKLFKPPIYIFIIICQNFSKKVKESLDMKEFWAH